MKQFFKSCEVFHRPEGFFIFGVIDTPYGGITVPPASKLPLTATASELSHAVLQILNALPNQVTDVNLATAGQPYLAYLKEIGFKNPTAFAKKAFLVAVYFDGEFYGVVPHQKDGHGAFVATGSTKLHRNSPVEQVGTAVLDALEKIR